MNRKPLIWSLIAACHLGLVVCGAARVNLADVPGVGPALQLYGSLSGAENGYGFFAPGVCSQVRPRFTLTDGRRVWTDRLEAGMSHEAELRVGSGLSLSSYPELWDYLGASWSATLLGRNPGADQVLVTIEAHDVPSMAEYRNGVRPSWITLYQGVFTTQPTAPEPETR
jgi:hypothetical protein